ncbi:hypothetical protein J3Q64DRAFT_1807557 [Phycomyces blakesleeanus]|uniref:DNA repair protein Rad4 n=1 Tax=Phycomyces blakesleeanus TaxID=4837 RepID=A0ABR3BFG7_PHYBL
MVKRAAKRKKTSPTDSTTTNKNSDSDFEDQPPTKRITRSQLKQVSSDSSPQLSNPIKSSKTKATPKGEDIDQPKPVTKKQKNTAIIEPEEPKESSLSASETFEDLPSQLSDRECDESDSDSEGEGIDWENVELPDGYLQERLSQGRVYNDVEVVFEAPHPMHRKNAWELAYERMLREWIHNSHVLTLIAHYTIRNRWCASPEVQSVCLSIVPNDVQKQCYQMTSSNNDFENGVKSLYQWWNKYFKLSGDGLVTRSYEEISFLENIDILNPKKDAKSIEEILKGRGIDDGETIKNCEDFVNHLLTKTGTRDTSAELFVAVLRALGYDARLVCSLQPVPYRMPARRPDIKKMSSTEKANQKEDELEATKESSQNNIKFPYRMSRPKTTSSQYHNNKLHKAKHPTVWAEVYNPHRAQWVSIDPIRGFYDNPRAMEPLLNDKKNVMSYVLAFYADGDGCVDVTRRYSSRITKAYKLRERELTKREKQGGFIPWSSILLRCIKRHRYGEREIREEKELEEIQEKDPMPTSIQGFHNHPHYALERHLKKMEILYPKEPVIGYIKGEPIYPRDCVKEIHTPETWMKLGRIIKKGEHPVKRINARAATIEKRRAIEHAKQDGNEVLADCYGEWQTIPYVPQPGHVPRNSYGNIDLFTPEMLPEGASHIPIQGIGKIAKKLGIDYADAVIDFEFAKGRSIPVIKGIVVPEESEEFLLEAWQEHHYNEATKELEKRRKEVYGNWRKLIKSVLIQARLEEDYGEKHSP